MLKRTWRTVLRCLAAAALVAAPVRAQDTDLSVRGRVLGPDNRVLANQRVVLHRVDAAGGATIAETTTGQDGRFDLRAPPSTDTAAVYFVAARYEGELYIGPPFRPQQQTAMEQVIQVGVPGTSASSMLGEADRTPVVPGRPATSRNWLLLLIPLLGVVGVALYALLGRPRVATERSLLLRVAELDERMMTAPDAQRASLHEERSRLIARLRGG